MAVLLATALLFFAAQDEGPVRTTRPDAVTPAQAARPIEGEAEYTPPGAPEDDYAFVAWCHGVLSGHRDLARALGAQLETDADSKAMEADLEKIGSEYLASYQTALLTTEMSKPRLATERAMAAREAGYRKWEAALAAAKAGGATADVDPKGTYFAWSLPGRCEHATNRLIKGEDLLSAAYKLPPETAAAQPALAEAAATPPAPSAAAEGDRKSGWLDRLKRRF